MKFIQTLESLIAQKLQTAYPQISVYTKQKKQGTNIPCFFLSCKHASLSKGLGKKYTLSYTFSISFYHPNPSQHIEDVLSHLQYLGEKEFRPQRISFTVSQNVADISLEIQIPVYPDLPETSHKMKQMEDHFHLNETETLY